MAVLWFEPRVAVPRLFLPTELHLWLPFGYLSAISEQALQRHAQFSLLLSALTPKMYVDERDFLV